MLATGEFDYAWNLQIEPEVLEQMVTNGKGTVVAGFGTMVERLVVNQTNNDPDLGKDKRSLHLDGTNPHPFLSDPAVRRALSLAIDRQILIDFGYGAAGQSSRPGESHPEALTEPCLNLSAHTAPPMQPYDK